MILFLLERMPGFLRYRQKKQQIIEPMLPMEQYGMEQYAGQECVYGIGICLLTAGFGIGILVWMQVWHPEYLFSVFLAAVTAEKEFFHSRMVRLRTRVLNQLAEYLDFMRHAYYRSRSVEDAIYEAWSQAGEEWKLHLAVMEEGFLGEIPIPYRKHPPDRHILHFLALCQCAIRFDDGDTEKNNGFMDNLEELQKSLYLEQMMEEREKELFLFTVPGLLMPLLFLPVLERWTLAQLPELQFFYRGPWGGLARLFLCLIFEMTISLFRYLKQGKSGRTEASKVGRTTDTAVGYLLKRERRDRAHFMSRFLLAWNHMEGSFGVWTARQYQQYEPMRKLTEFYRTRLRYIVAAFFLWVGWWLWYRMSLWWLLPGVLWMLIASMLPFVDLFLAGEFYVNQREAEVHRFHSVLYLLSEIPQVTTEAILEWLERFSYYYQRVLSECLDQSSFLEEWLQESGEGSEHGSFRQILEDIMACDKVGVKEAFRDIVVKREFWMDRFRQHQEMALRKKEVYIQALLYVPFGASVTLYLILPFFYESMKSMQTFMEFV